MIRATANGVARRCVIGDSRAATADPWRAIAHDPSGAAERGCPKANRAKSMPSSVSNSNPDEHGNAPPEYTTSPNVAPLARLNHRNMLIHNNSRNAVLTWAKHRAGSDWAAYAARVRLATSDNCASEFFFEPGSKSLAPGISVG